MGHRGGADLPLGKALTGQFVASHNTERLGEARGTRSKAHEDGDDFEIKPARVDLADIIQCGTHAKMIEDAIFEQGDLFRVPPKECK